MMDDGFKKLKEDDLTNFLEKSLLHINDGMKDLRAWVRWIVGAFCVGVRYQ